MKRRESGLGVLGAVAAGATLVGTLAMGCGGGGSTVFVPQDTAGDDPDNDDQQQTLVQPADRADLAILLAAPRDEA